MKAFVRSITRFDIVACTLILCVGGFQLAFVERGSAFYSGDTTYLELARSLLRHHLYGFDFRAETTLPPGFPAMLAGLITIAGDAHDVLVRAVVVCATLGTVLTYFLIRTAQGPLPATIICLLIATSPPWFSFVSRVVFSDMPYFLLSVGTLLLMERLDAANGWTARTGWWMAAGAGLVASVLTRSSGVALVGGLCVWIVASSIARRDGARRRALTFGTLALIGIATQFAWTAWGRPRAINEWPIGGYPKPYLAQLEIKNGNEPDQGPLSAGDVPALVAHNAGEHAATLDYLISKKGTFERDWFLPWIAGPIALIAIGLLVSIWPSGGRPYDWYFAVYESIFLVWPWDFELRFFLPIAPLACLYVWRGGAVALQWIAARQRRPVAIAATASAALGAIAFAHAWPSHDLQAWAAVLLWIAIAAPLAAAAARDTAFLANLVESRWTRAAALCACVLLLEIGLSRDAVVARDNRTFDMSQDVGYPQIEAARWLHDHTPADVIVMARQLDVVYHYADRRVVWFPPTANTQVLMDGILKHHVDFIVIVARGADTYWRPGEESAFDRVLARYPAQFATVQEGVREKIYAVVHPSLEDGPTESN